jgi:hypothetical protein
LSPQFLHSSAPEESIENVNLNNLEKKTEQKLPAEADEYLPVTSAFHPARSWAA